MKRECRIRNYELLIKGFINDQWFEDIRMRYIICLKSLLSVSGFFLF